MKYTQSILEESAGYRIFFNLFYITKLLKEEKRNPLFVMVFRQFPKPFQGEYDTSVPSWGKTGDVDLDFKNNNVCQSETHRFKPE